MKLCVLSSHSYDRQIFGKEDNYEDYKNTLLYGSSFIRCEFINIMFDQIFIKHCIFDECKFIGCGFINSSLYQSNVIKCDIDNTLISSFTLKFTNVDHIIGKKLSIEDSIITLNDLNDCQISNSYLHNIIVSYNVFIDLYTYDVFGSEVSRDNNSFTNSKGRY